MVTIATFQTFSEIRSTVTPSWLPHSTLKMVSSPRPLSLVASLTLPRNNWCSRHNIITSVYSCHSLRPNIGVTLCRLADRLLHKNLQFLCRISMVVHLILKNKKKEHLCKAPSNTRSNSSYLTWSHFPSLHRSQYRSRSNSYRKSCRSRSLDSENRNLYRLLWRRTHPTSESTISKSNWSAAKVVSTPRPTEEYPRRRAPGTWRPPSSLEILPPQRPRKTHKQ